MIGEDGEWDSILVVRYPSKEAFLQMLRIPAYQAVTRYRTEALIDARLIACEPTAQGGRDSPSVPRPCVSQS